MKQLAPYPGEANLTALARDYHKYYSDHFRVPPSTEPLMILLCQTEAELHILQQSLSTIVAAGKQPYYSMPDGRQVAHPVLADIAARREQVVTLQKRLGFRRGKLD